MGHCDPNNLFEGLSLRVGLIKNPHELNASERESLWTVAARTYSDAIKAGYADGEAKRIIAAWLGKSVPTLAKSPQAILRQLYRKIERLESGGHLRDRRRDSGAAKRAPKLSDNDRKTLVGVAVKSCSGQIDFAWRICRKQKLLSAELLDRYSAPTNHLEECPKRIARQIRYEVNELCEASWRLRWYANNVAPVTRDWSGVFAQDFFSCDDKTLDVYCRVQDGAGEWKAIRCQFLPMTDVKSGFILDFVLIPERNYDSISVRTLIKNVCSRYGLPTKGFVLENGLWRTSKLLGNAPKRHGNGRRFPSVEFPKIENFATRLGLGIFHALPGRARSKTVETVLRLFDKKCYGLPGYIGNDEMHRKREGVELSHLLTFDELFSKLEACADDYNTTLSKSVVKGGCYTPKEVWEGGRPRNEAGEFLPVVALAPEFEFLLGDIRSCQVTLNGVKFKVGNEEFHYWSAALTDFDTGLLGQEVKLSWFPDSPMSAVIYDLKEERVFPVERKLAAPAAAETECDWKFVAAAAEPHRAAMKQIRGRISNLRGYVPPFRLIKADAHTRMLAQKINVAREQGAQQVAAAHSKMNERARRLERNKSELEKFMRQDL